MPALGGRSAARWRALPRGVRLTVGLVVLAGLAAAVRVGTRGVATHVVSSAPRASRMPQPVLDETRVKRQLEALEYRPTVQHGVLSAPNRAQGLRLRWLDDGVRVEDRHEATHLATLSTVAVGRSGALRQLGSAPAKAEAGRVLRRWEGLTEWWVNEPKGAEQGWTVAARPNGAGPLHLRVAVEAARVEGSADGVVLRTEAGRVLAYGGLRVVDGRGRSVPASLRAVDTGLVIDVDDAAAQYPLTIDPVLSAPDWTVDGGQASSNFGNAVAGVGDVNGDGFADVVVGAYSYDNVDAGGYDNGAAFLFLGSAAGLEETPAWTAMADLSGAQFGNAVAGAGDVNGDGYADVIVAAYLYPAVDVDAGISASGKAFLYLGGATGLSQTPDWTAMTDLVPGGFGGPRFAMNVAGAGDVNGDGYSDVLVAAYNYQGLILDGGGATGDGAAFLYLGSKDGLSPTYAWKWQNPHGECRTASGVGDVNGDGYSDIAVASYGGGSLPNPGGFAYLFLGGPDGPTEAPVWQYTYGSGSFTRMVASAGDVNGDGFSDLVAGASGGSRVIVFLGTADGGADGGAMSGPFVLSGPSSGFGSTVASAGDVNGDGYSDVVVGAGGSSTAYVHLGSPSGLSTVAAWSYTRSGSLGDAPAGGGGAAGAGDVNGDGFSDILLGARSANSTGQAYLFLGSASGPSNKPTWRLESSQPQSDFGATVAGAGDVNADGFSDVIVGADTYDNGEADEGRAFLFLGTDAGLAAAPAWTAEADQEAAHFGSSVAGVGDVNADGYADVVVGARDLANGEDREGAGAAFLYLGGAGGLEADPAWTAEADQEAAGFGSAVARAGDVNGDGYADVLVGAPGFSNGEWNEGRVFLYLGGASGLGVKPVWTAESDQADAYFGASVAGAGDVNGDALSDVIVGAFGFDEGSVADTDEGRAVVFLGNAESGLSAEPDWSIVGDQAGAWLGGSVAGAGDVNGDGYSDVVVGARLYDNGEDQEGAAFLYLGSAAGLEATPAWMAESNQAYAYLGGSVAGAGDVNGDGYSDVAVGARDYDMGRGPAGRVFLFLGTAAGLSATAVPWSVWADQPGASFGAAVVGAGDVNGDGFADLVVGAVGFNQITVPDAGADGGAGPGGETDEGAIFLFLGGDGAADGGAGLPRGLTQRFGDAVVGPGARVSLAGRLEGRTINATSPLYAHVRLETEVKPIGTPFDGKGIARSAPVLPGAVAWTGLPDVPAGRYHWRARVVAGDSPGRWVSFGGNDESESDFVRVAESAMCSEPWAYTPVAPTEAGVAAHWSTSDTAPEGLSVDEDTGAIEWTPTPAQYGDHRITLVVKAGANTRQLYPVDVFVDCPNKVAFPTRCGCASGTGALAWLAVGFLLRRRRR